MAGSSAPPSDGGGSASPSAPPSADPPAAPDTSGDMDWSNLGSAEDLDHIEIPAEVPPPPAAAAPKKYGAAATPPADPASTTPPVQPQAPTPAPAAPPAAAAPTTPTPAAEAPPVQLSPSDPLGIATALEQHRDTSIAHLAQTRFALSQEDIAELEDNAAAFVPKMMARVHHEAQVSMMKFLAQAVPGMMQQFNTVTKANTAAEDQFFDAHKALGLDKTNKEHRAAAFRMAKLYRQSHPQMPLEQLIAEVGPIVAMSLKLSPVPGGQPPGGVAANLQPQPTGRPVAFRPAVNGGGGVNPNPAPANEWSGMGGTYDDE